MNNLHSLYANPKRIYGLAFLFQWISLIGTNYFRNFHFNETFHHINRIKDRLF